MEELTDEMREFVKAHDTALPHLVLKDPNNKWLVRSALQKAMRRGRVEEAIKCAAYLATLDATYLWKSLATVVIEDIGFGNPDLMTYVTAANSSKKLRQSVHESGLAAAIIEAACASAKSRSCCEVSLWRDWSAVDIFAQAAKRTTASLVQEACYGWMQNAYIAACTLRGMVPRGIERRPKDEQGLLEVLTFIVDALPYAHARAAMLCLEKPVDSMFCAAWPLFKLLNGNEEAPAAVPDSLPPEEQIKGLSSAAFDMHTAEGKRALKAFYTSLCKDYPLIATIPSEKAVRALGATVFVVEGGQVDRRLTALWLDDLKTKQDCTFITGCGVLPYQVPQVIEIVQGEIPRLNSKRKWAVTV